MCCWAHLPSLSELRCHQFRCHCPCLQWLMQLITIRPGCLRLCDRWHVRLLLYLYWQVESNPLMQVQRSCTFIAFCMRAWSPLNPLHIPPPPSFTEASVCFGLFSDQSSRVMRLTCWRQQFGRNILQVHKMQTGHDVMHSMASAAGCLLLQLVDRLYDIECSSDDLQGHIWSCAPCMHCCNF